VHRDLLIQEIIPGPDSQLLFSHLYIDKSGRLAAAWTGRKIRQRPVGFGTSTMAETLWDPMVAELSSSLMCAIGARGYASVEFKRDPGSDSYKLIEATVARTWYPHYLGTVAGVNLSLVWYRDLIGAELPRTRRVADRVKWIDEYRDVWGGYERWREHGLPLADWVCSYRGTKAFALASLRDPLPSLCLVVKILLDIAARLRKVLVDAVSNRQPELDA
jgi:predicted ATP-grasp superfamily ATP-dependent carboligase